MRSVGRSSKALSLKIVEREREPYFLRMANGSLGTLVRTKSMAGELSTRKMAA